MQLILQLQEPWKSVAIDFIVKLPKSRDSISEKEYNSILIITNWLIKEAKFASINKATNAPNTAHLVMREVVATEGLSNKWITNRDLKFMSHFWQTLMARLGVKYKASTAYYPQTNEQNKQLNQTLEQYLQNYVNYNQTN
jgi:hypothetical protein